MEHNRPIRRQIDNKNPDKGLWENHKLFIRICRILQIHPAATRSFFFYKESLLAGVLFRSAVLYFLLYLVDKLV